jgi:outer membrane receptor for ferrienterochelin and colicins
MRVLTKYIGFILLITTSLLSYTQDNECQFQIKDVSTGLPLSYAHIKIICTETEINQNQTSDIQGFIHIKCKESFTIEISHLGYETLYQLFQNCSSTAEILLNPISSYLPEFVITAQHKKITQRESVYSINQINTEKIHSRGATTINEVLNTEMNTRLSNRPGWSGTNVNLQGFSGEQVNIMIDGIPVSGRLNGNIDLQQINLNNTEKIEILHGPVSVIYGSNSSGGAINIVTAENNDKKFGFKSRAYYESVGQFNISGNFAVAHKNNFINAGGGRNFFGGYSPIDSSRNKLWLQREQYFGDFSYKRKFKNMELKIASNIFFEETKDRGDKRAPNFTTAFDTYYNTQRHINRLHYNWRISDEYALEISSAVSVFKRDREKFFRDLTTLEFFATGEGDTTLQIDYYVRPVFSRKLSNAIWNYQVGFEVAHSKLDADRIEGDIAKMTEYAVFINTYFYPFKNNKLTINPGIRYIYNNNYRAPLVYALNFSSLIGKEFTLKGSVAKGFRTPTIKELYLDFPFSESIQVYGNNDLKAEISNHVRIAGDWQKRKGTHAVKIELTWFFNNLNNMITTAQVSDTKWMYVNIGNFKSIGYNFMAKYKNSFSEWNAGFNYTGFMFNPDKENSKSSFKYSPEFVFSSSITIPLIEVSWDNHIKYTGRLSSQYIAANNSLEQSFIGAHTLWDMSLRRKFWEDRINLVVGVKNLTHVINVPIQGKVYGYNTAKDASEML